MGTRTPEEPLLQLGFRVRQARCSVGLSQEDLADRAGVHRTYIGTVERGERNVSLLNLLKLSRALGMDPCELVRGLTDDG